MEQLVLVPEAVDTVVKKKRRYTKKEKINVKKHILNSFWPFLFPEDYPEEYIEQLMAKESMTWLDDDIRYLQKKLWADSMKILAESPSTKALDDVLRWVFAPKVEDYDDFSFQAIALELLNVPYEFARSAFLNFVTSQSVQTTNPRRKAIFSKVANRFSNEIDVKVRVKLNSTEQFTENAKVLNH